MKKIKTLIPTIAAISLVGGVTPVVSSCTKDSSTTFTLKFNSQGGSKVADQKVRSGELAVEPKSPTRTGYTFIGWYKDSECKYEFDFEQDKVTADLTLYAKWQEGTVEKHIDKLISSQVVEVTDQNVTKATYTFQANEVLDTNKLTALVKVHDSQSTSFVVDAKGYIEVSSKSITLTVTYSAANVTALNDECLYDIYFTNTDPDNAWAECFKNLGLKYTSPILNSSLESKGYLFTGTTSGKRRLSVQLASNSTFTTAIPEISTTTGRLTVKNPTAEIIEQTKTVKIEFDYDSSLMEAGESSDCELTLTLNNYQQKFTLNFTAAPQIYPVNTEANVTTGSQICSYYCALALPLGSNETLADFETIEITDLDTNNTITPVLYTSALDDNKDYISFYVQIKDALVVRSGKAKFAINVVKKDNSSKGTGYTTGWTKKIEGLTLNYTGRALTLSQTLFDYSSEEYQISSGDLLSIIMPFDQYGTFTHSELPREITWSTDGMEPLIGGSIYPWDGSLFKEHDKVWNQYIQYDTLWTFNPYSDFKTGIYTHSMHMIVYWGTGSDYTKQRFDFKVKTNCLVS